MHGTRYELKHHDGSTLLFEDLGSIDIDTMAFVGARSLLVLVRE